MSRLAPRMRLRTSFKPAANTGTARERVSREPDWRPAQFPPGVFAGPVMLANPLGGLGPTRRSVQSRRARSRRRLVPPWSRIVFAKQPARGRPALDCILDCPRRDPCRLAEPRRSVAGDLSEEPLVKVPATAKAVPDREADVGDKRSVLGSRSNLCRVFGLAFVFLLDASLQHANAGRDQNSPLAICRVAGLPRLRRMPITLDFSTALDPLS